MTSGDNEVIWTRKAILEDIDAIKRLTDRHRTELGFVLRPSLEQSIRDGELIVAVRGQVIVGLIHYHHRRDQQTTVYHFAVDLSNRRCGIGRTLVDDLVSEAREVGKEFILLKCPVKLIANEFYRSVGFILVRTETGKERQLNVWQLQLQ